MNDPYKVLNIPPTATDDEVKHAYRELARKYHPDNYHDNPLADLAQEKMKEINEAYELVQKQRKSGAGQSASYRADSGSPGGRGGYSGGYTGSYASGSYSDSAGGNPYQRIRAAINRGDLNTAERLLGTLSRDDAEWHYLTGVILSYRGRLDDARRSIETACRLDPSNQEYRMALSRFSRGGYRPAGYRPSGTLSYGSDCAQYCMTLAVCSMCLPGGCYCMPCYI